MYVIIIYYIVQKIGPTKAKPSAAIIIGAAIRFFGINRSHCTLCTSISIHKDHRITTTSAQIEIHNLRPTHTVGYILAYTGIFHQTYKHDRPNIE